MDRFLERSEKLLTYVYYKGGNVSILELSEYLQVGNSTIERDCRYIESIMDFNQLIIKNGYLSIKTNMSLLIDQTLKKLYQENLFFKIIILLFKENKYSISQLSTILNVSRATTYRKCFFIRIWLQENELDLVTSPVCKIIGEELNIRNLMQQFYDFYLPRSLSKISFFEKDQFINEITEYCSYYKVKLETQSLRKIIILLKVIHIRSEFSKNLKIDIFANEEHSVHINIAKKLHHYFPKYMDKKNYQSEYLYFAINILNHLISKNKKKLEDIYLSKDTDLYSDMIFKFLEGVSRDFYFDFSSDITLVEEINRYIEKYYIDLRLGTNHRLNNLTGYINVYKAHPFYSLVKKELLNLFKQHNGPYKIKEIDIFTIFLFLSISQLRIKRRQKISVAIIGDSELEYNNLGEYIELKYPYNVRLDRLNSYALIKNIFYQNYDLIINTGQNINEYEYVETLIVSPILSDADKENIDCKINEILNNKMTKYPKLLVSELM